MATTIMKGDPNKEILVSVHEVYWDHNWNARADLGAASGGPDDEDTGLGEIDEKGNASGLIAAILQRTGGAGEPGYKGQLTPVFLRTRRPTDTFPKQYNYFGVAGFRRGAAILRIAEYQKDKKALIKAKAWDMSDAEARELNILENAARQNLSGPDLAYGVLRLRQENKAATQAVIANILNKSQGYVAKLVGITGNIKGQYEGQTILDHWRKSPAGSAVTIDQMYQVSQKETPEEQSKKYTELVRTRSGGNTKRGSAAKVEAAQKRAREVGETFGMLVRESAIKLTGEPAEFFAEYLSEFMTVPEETDPKKDEKTGKITDPGIVKADVRSVFKAAKDGFKAGLTAVEEDEEEESEEEKPRKRKGNSTASSAN